MGGATYLFKLRFLDGGRPFVVCSNDVQILVAEQPCGHVPAAMRMMINAPLLTMRAPASLSIQGRIKAHVSHGTSLLRTACVVKAVSSL